MALQIIDTTTNNGSYIGDPAKVAFEKINTMTRDIYGWTVDGMPLSLINGGLLRIGKIGEGQARIAMAAGNVYWDSYDTFNGSLPNATAFHRAGNHNWTNGSGVTVATLDGSGGYSARGLTATGTSAKLGFLERSDNAREWQWYATGGGANLWATGYGNRMSVSLSGQVTATSFNPTSSADVKDYITGYAGDADAELDRLVVIRYKYRPEFADTGERYFIGLLAENVRDVQPLATGGDYDTLSQDDEGGEVTEHVPLNVDMMQLLAINTRAHQQKSRRIRYLEGMVAGLVARLDALETGA